MLKNTYRNSNYSEAIVIGAGIAGLMTARVLAKYFAKVIVIEKDILNPPLNDFSSSSFESRASTPQGSHVHLLLAKGVSIIENLFSNFFNIIMDKGVIKADITGDIRFFEKTWKPIFNANKYIYLMTRQFLESNLREYLHLYPNITILSGYRVEKLILSKNGADIIGVQVSSYHTDRTEVKNIHADFIVDASGRGTRFPQWLKNYCDVNLEKAEITTNRHYVSCIYKKPQNFVGDWKTLLIRGIAPHGKKSGTISMIENNSQDSRWIVTLAGLQDECPSTSAAMFLEYARQLPTDEIYKAICEAEPLSEHIQYKFPSSRRFHYEKLKHLPNRFIVIGDALCSFNPIYAQGMTVCTLQAHALDTLLNKLIKSKNINNLQKKYFKKVSKIINNPWNFAAVQDFRYHETKGKKPRHLSILHWYLDQIMELATHSPKIWLEVVEIFHMEKKARSLLHPTIIFNLLKHRYSKKFSNLST